MTPLPDESTHPDMMGCTIILGVFIIGLVIGFVTGILL